MKYLLFPILFVSCSISARTVAFSDENLATIMKDNYTIEVTHLGCFGQSQSNYDISENGHMVLQTITIDTSSKSHKFNYNPGVNTIVKDIMSKIHNQDTSGLKMTTAHDSYKIYNDKLCIQLEDNNTSFYFDELFN